MAIKLYLRSATGTPTVGTDETHRLTSDPGVGTAVTYTKSTVTGPTAPLQFTNGANNMTWVSQYAVASDTTIAGTVTVNLRGKVDASAANATLEAKVIVVDNTGAITATIVAVPPGTIPAALGTSDGAINYSVTPTSTLVSAGKYVGIQVQIDDAVSVTMASGHTVTLSIDAGNGSAVAGDSWVQFTENIPFNISTSDLVIPSNSSLSTLLSSTSPPGQAQRYRHRGIVSGSSVYWYADAADYTGTTYNGGVTIPTDIVVVPVQNAKGNFA